MAARDQGGLCDARRYVPREVGRLETLGACRVEASRDALGRDGKTAALCCERWMDCEVYRVKVDCAGTRSRRVREPGRALLSDVHAQILIPQRRKSQAGLQPKLRTQGLKLRVG